MDTALEASMSIHRADKSIMKFMEFRMGLCYHDTNPSINSTSEYVSGYSFVTTVAGNKDRYLHCKIEVADCAWELYTMIGCPLQQQFEHILNNNLISNCPVMVDNARRTGVRIYGPNVQSLNGKTT